MFILYAYIIITIIIYPIFLTIFIIILVYETQYQSRTTYFEGNFNPNKAATLKTKIFK